MLAKSPYLACAAGTAGNETLAATSAEVKSSRLLVKGSRMDFLKCVEIRSDGKKISVLYVK